MTTSVRPVLEKAAQGMVVIDSGRTTLFKQEQPENAPSPISVTDSGMTTSVRLVHPLKVCCPIIVTEEGSVMLFSPVQPLKADSPILVTEAGMSMLVRPPQPKTASASISATRWNPVRTGMRRTGSQNGAKGSRRIMRQHGAVRSSPKKSSKAWRRKASVSCGSLLHGRI